MHLSALLCHIAHEIECQYAIPFYPFFLCIYLDDGIFVYGLMTKWHFCKKHAHNSMSCGWSSLILGFSCRTCPEINFSSPSHIFRFFSKSLKIMNYKWTRLRTNPSPLVADISKCWPFCTITLGIKAFKLAVQRKLKGCPSWQRVAQCRIFGGGGKN